MKKSMNMLNSNGGLWAAWDDFTNAELDPDGVRGARKTEPVRHANTEIKLLEEMKTCTRCPT